MGSALRETAAASCPCAAHHAPLREEGVPPALPHRGHVGGAGRAHALAGREGDCNGEGGDGCQGSGLGAQNSNVATKQRRVAGWRQPPLTGIQGAQGVAAPPLGADGARPGAVQGPGGLRGGAAGAGRRLHRGNNQTTNRGGAGPPVSPPPFPATHQRFERHPGARRPPRRAPRPPAPTPGPPRAASPRYSSDAVIAA